MVVWEAASELLAYRHEACKFSATVPGLYGNEYL